MKIKIKKGTLIKESETGHYNFQYPLGEEYEATCDIEARPLSWMDPTSKGYKACLTTNMDKNRIIWVLKTDI